MEIRAFPGKQVKGYGKYKNKKTVISTERAISAILFPNLVSLPSST
jgi:hypothetical protein